MITSTGKIIRFSLTSVSQIGRSTQGVKLMDVEEKERIQSITIFKPEVQDDATAPIDEEAISNEQTLKLQDIPEDISEENK
jgi:DNA gyrase subunit A